jgi:hypothetical protein
MGKVHRDPDPIVSGRARFHAEQGTDWINTPDEQLVDAE